MARSSSGAFSRPLVRELDVSPAVLRRLAARFPERYPVLFDSAAEGPLSQASVLVAEPRAALWLDASGHLGSEGVLPRGTTFLSALENWWLAEREPVPPSASQSTASRAQAGDALAFAGGWALFLGYEIAQEVERRAADLAPHKRPTRVVLHPGPLPYSTTRKVRRGELSAWLAGAGGPAS